MIDKAWANIHVLHFKDLPINNFFYNNEFLYFVSFPTKLLFSLRIQMKTCTDLKNFAQNVPGG